MLQDGDAVAIRGPKAVQIIDFLAGLDESPRGWRVASRAATTPCGSPRWRRRTGRPGISKLLPTDELAEFLFEVLQDGDAVAIRGPKAVPGEIIGFLAGLDTEGIAAGVARCLTSSDDTVRIAAVAALRTYAEPATRDALPFSVACGVRNAATRKYLAYSRRSSPTKRTR